LGFIIHMEAICRVIQPSFCARGHDYDFDCGHLRDDHLCLNGS